MSKNKSEFDSKKSYLNSILLSEETLPVNVSGNKVNLSELCRTCLCNTSGNDMNNKTLCIVTANRKLLPLYHLFEVATGRKFDFNSTLPHRLCHTCLNLLINSYTIRTQSQRAEVIIECAMGRNEVGATLDDIVTNMNTIQVEDELKTENLETQNQAANIFSNERVGSGLNSSVIFIVPDENKEVTVSHTESLKEECTSNEGQWKCMLCEKYFLHYRELLLHYKICPQFGEPVPRYQSEVHARCSIRSDKLMDQQQKYMRMVKSKSQSQADAMASHKRQHHCPNCEQKFLQVTELKEHLLTHTNNDIDELYYCTQCAKQWTTQQGWTLHMNQHQIEEEKRNRQLKIVPDENKEVTVSHTESLKEECTSNEGQWKCMLCEKYFLHYRELLLHYKICPQFGEPVPRYQSEVHARCSIRSDKLMDQQQKYMRMVKSKSQSQADAMASHKRQHHCPNCEQKFLQVTELKEHLLTHTNNDIDELYYCTQCAKQWTTQQGWTLHMNQHQIEEEKRNRQLKIVPDENKEVTVSHTESLKEECTSNEGQWKCMLCEKYFLHYRELLLHYKICPQFGEPVPRYQSEVHARCSIRSDKLMDQQQKYMRMVKSKSQSQADAMASHKRQHHCPNCEQKFLQVTELKEHLLTHTNNDIDELYYCTQCAKQWTTQQGWTLHMNQHQIEEEKRNRQLSE